LDVAQCCYNLTTKKLCLELQPLRVGHGATASDAPHHCEKRGRRPSAYFAKRWQDRKDLAQTVTLYSVPLVQRIPLWNTLRLT
jgi:hypothetical protein